MNPGVLYSSLAYICWGLVPLYFMQLSAVGALEVSMASGAATKATLAAPIGTLLAMHNFEPVARAG